MIPFLGVVKTVNNTHAKTRSDYTMTILCSCSVSLFWEDLTRDDDQVYVFMNNAHGRWNT